MSDDVIYCTIPFTREKLYAITIDEAHVLNKNTLQLKYIIVIIVKIQVF
jgi:hypothetical protein